MLILAFLLINIFILGIIILIDSQISSVSALFQRAMLAEPSVSWLNVSIDTHGSKSYGAMRAAGTKKPIEV